MNVLESLYNGWYTYQGVPYHIYIAGGGDTRESFRYINNRTLNTRQYNMLQAYLRLFNTSYNSELSIQDPECCNFNGDISFKFKKNVYIYEIGLNPVTFNIKLSGEDKLIIEVTDGDRVNRFVDYIEQFMRSEHPKILQCCNRYGDVYYRDHNLEYSIDPVTLNTQIYSLEVETPSLFQLRPKKQVHLVVPRRQRRVTFDLNRNQYSDEEF